MEHQSAPASASAEFGITLGSSTGRVWGQSGEERLKRIFHRAGLETIEVRDLPASSSAGVVLARADWVFDEKLISALAKKPDAILIGPGGKALAAHVRASEALRTAAALLDGQDPGAGQPNTTRLQPDELAYDFNLRKREEPVLELLNEANVRHVEARLFKGSYKGVTDIVTKYWWPVPARIVTRWCALTGVTPNLVTFMGFLLVLAAFALFWQGHFGLGLVCAWVMTFLDTVDGKLARVTLTSSKWGHLFDHGIDLVHPPFWWWAWLVGVQASGFSVPFPELTLWVIVGGYVAQRIEEGLFMRRFLIHMHSWRPFDSWFRLITARRNPNLLLLTPAAFAARPDIGILAIAAWTALSFLVHLVRLLQAYMTPRAKVVSWMSQ